MLATVRRTMLRVAAFAALVALAPQVSVAGQNDDLAASLRNRIHHVFIIYQENHSYDNYFGTYPGSENLATPLAQSHGFKQFDAIGKQSVTPFRITDPDTESPSQSRTVIADKMAGGKMDAFISTQERLSAKRFDPAGARDIGLLTMSHYDCDTIPFIWKYADTFTLFDHMFTAMAGPSTPAAIALIAGQAGQTQRARDPQRSDRARRPRRGRPGGQRSRPGVRSVLREGKGVSDSPALRDADADAGGQLGIAGVGRDARRRRRSGGDGVERARAGAVGLVPGGLCFAAERAARLRNASQCSAILRVSSAERRLLEERARR